MEHIEGFHLLARTDELDWFLHHRADTERSTSAGVAVEFGKDNAIEIQTVVERFGGVHSILAGHGINHEQSFLRLDSLFDSGNLGHHLLVNSETTGRIDDHNIVAIDLSLSDGFLGFLNGIAYLFARENLGINLLAKNAQLFDSSGTIDVVGNEHDFLAFFRLEIVGELGGKGCLTRTLQTGEQDNSRIAFQVQLHGFCTHQGGQFVVGDLHHQLSRTHRGHHVLADGFRLDGISKLLGSLVVNVRLQEGFADVLNGFGYVNLGDTAFTFQYLERPFQPFA